MSEQVCTSREHQIVDALFGDLDMAGLADLHKHLDSCSGCAHGYQQMQQTISITSQVPEPEMSEAYWDSYFDHLQERMASSKGSLLVSERWLRVQNGFKSMFMPRPAVLRWSTALALVLIGVLIGRQWGTTSADMPGSGPRALQIDPFLTPVQLSEKTERYLDRSKVLLLGLVNFEVGEDDPAFINLAQQQQVAGELIQEAALLKGELSGNHEQQLSALVEELEMILLQIANLELQQDVPSIELIQRGVDRGSLLLKINVEKMKLSDQEMDDQKETKAVNDARFL